jgi:hypothetical protein
VKAITPPLVAMLIPILPIFAYIKILGRSRSGDMLELLIVGIVASLLCLWYAVSLWYLGVVPFLRGRPRLYDLMEDQVRVIYKDRSSLTIHFSEVKSLRFTSTKVNAQRPLRARVLDPFGRIPDPRSFTLGTWVREVLLNILPPYSFGFGAEGEEIHVRLTKGHTIMRVFFPWRNTPLKSRDLSLSPFDAREFFSQFDTAFTKWKRQKG